MIDLEKCWTQHAIVVADVETCGLNPEDGVCDIAVVRFADGVVVDQFTSLVNPGRPIPPECTAIHGIADDQVKDAPTLSMLAPEILRVADQAAPCAYSADFDMGFIRHEISGTECALFDPAFAQWLDVLVVVRDKDRYERGAGRHKLDAACRRRGIVIEGAHRALPDAVATGKLLYAMLDRGEIKPCPLGKLLEHIAKRKREQEAAFHEWLARQPKREEQAT